VGDGSPDDGTLRDGSRNDGASDGTSYDGGETNDATVDTTLEAAGDGAGDTGGDASGDAAGDAPIDTGGDANDSSTGMDAGPPDTGVACGTGSTCVDPVPGGWTGPVALADFAFGASSPGCPTPYTIDAYDGEGTPTQPPLVCKCKCGGASGASCAPNTVTVYTDSNCQASCYSTADPYCNNTSCGSSSAAASVSPPAVADAGSCTPSLTTTTPPWQWTRAARACQAPTVGTACGSGGSCMAVPASPYLPKVCVMGAGDVPCPGGSYSSKSVYYTGATDQRGCAGCVCETPGGVGCSGAVIDSYGWPASAACDPAVSETIPADGGCHTLTTQAYWVGEVTASMPSSGTCRADGGAPVGQITPNTPTTVCCQP